MVDRIALVFGKDSFLKGAFNIIIMGIVLVSCARTIYDTNIDTTHDVWLSLLSFTCIEVTEIPLPQREAWY